MVVVTNLSERHKVVPALCLDFDGTIRRSKSNQTFIQNFKDIELIPGVENLIWKYRDAGWLILGISNQAGVAHGFKLPMEIENEMDFTFKLFKQNPFHIVKFCYHDGKGKIAPYNHRSLLRKPDIGMLALMESEAFSYGYVIDWDKSLFVGDRPEDEQCAKNAGVNFRHIDSFLSEPHVFIINQ
jgi:D-glycero-D-manno-heptose 1,7-bisphosphate phosphatase